MGILRASLKKFGWHIISATLFIGMYLVIACAWCHVAHAKEIKEIKYLGNYPSNKKGSWTHRLQGIAHSGSDWLFTQKQVLWKVPVHFDLRKTKKLSTNQNKWPGVRKVGMPQVLKNKKYDHFGDLDCARGYIFIPVEGGNRTPVIAVFKYPTLQFIDYAEMTGKKRAGWCAISNNGELFTSHNAITQSTPIEIYAIDWNLLRRGKLKLRFKKYYRLTGIPAEYGRDISTYVQGGDFSDDGNYLFIVNGKMLNPTKRIKEKTGDKGVWVFRNNNNMTGRFVMKSNQKKGFRYQFKPGSFQEPEGITYWDLDKKVQKNKHNEGQLHVILLNKLNTAKHNSTWIKHYRIYWR
jgi:hypothetical protein